MIQIRLKKINRHARSVYHLVITKKTKASSRGYLEKLGTYNPVIDRWGNKYFFLNKDRLFYWIAKGVTVENLLPMWVIYPLFY